MRVWVHTGCEMGSSRFETGKVTETGRRSNTCKEEGFVWVYRASPVKWSERWSVHQMIWPLTVSIQEPDLLVRERGIHMPDFHTHPQVCLWKMYVCNGQGVLCSTHKQHRWGLIQRLFGSPSHGESLLSSGTSVTNPGDREDWNQHRPTTSILLASSQSTNTVH